MNFREDLRQFLNMPKILLTHPKLLPNLEKLNQRSQNGLSPRHTVPILTPDGHTNITFSISPEVNPEDDEK